MPDRYNKSIMGTGACGIDCSVCRLHAHGVCGSCGGGTSDDGLKKIQAQIQKFGMACGILECSCKNRVAFCMRDCREFPCETFSKGPYPFSAGFLDMQARRIEQLTHPHKHPEATSASIEMYWDLLQDADAGEICRHARVEPSATGGFLVKVLHETWEVLPTEKTAEKVSGPHAGEWDRQMPFFILVYLLKSGVQCPSGRMIAPREVLKGREFFAGRHSIRTQEMEKHFRDDVKGFVKTGLALGGLQSGNGDASIMLDVFPKLTVEYILWRADEEFPARVKILLDSETRNLYPLDACERVINLLNDRYILSSKDYM